MNRLIIVGNGFDLAHGLRSSYCDFITDYLVSLVNQFHEKNFYEDPLIRLAHRAAQIHYRYPIAFPVTSDTVFEALEKLNKNDYFEVNFKSVLLQKTVQTTNEIKWVDLETDYFNELIACRNATNMTFSYEEVRLLNDQFQFLKVKLEQYLLGVQLAIKDFTIDPHIEKIFRAPIRKEDLLLDRTGGGQVPQRKMFLNFNYTNTLTKYLGVSKVISTLTHNTIERKDTINYIHGKLEDVNNPIIFGFGDEHDSNYQQFELSRNNDVFRHIKSFGYFKTVNYHNLIRFLTLDKFQVFVVGHSCGLSDRTMFREIFSHENCRSIKIFYHQRADGSNDFTEKTYDMARHFLNKGEMRKKIVPEPLSSPLPQYNHSELTKKS